MFTANEIKELVSIKTVIKTFNLNIDLNKRSPCPFCNSSTGFSIRGDKYFKCFRCGEFGDVYKLLQVTKNISFTESLKLVSSLVQDSGYKYSNRCYSLASIFELYKENESTLSIAKQYLNKRGLGQAAERFPVGICTEQDFLLKNSGLNKTELEELGLLSKSGKELFYNHIIFAYKDINNRITHLQGRCLDVNSSLRWISSINSSLPISNIVWGADCLQKWKEEFGYVFLCEGLTDCYSLLSLDFPAIATAGININLKRYTELLKGMTIIAIYDGDRYPVGDINSDMYKSWSAVLPTLIDLYKDNSDIDIKCVVLPSLPGIKDINDLVNHLDCDRNLFLDKISSNSLSIEEMSFKVFSSDCNYWDNIIKAVSVKRESRMEDKLVALINSKGLTNYLYNQFNDEC